MGSVNVLAVLDSIIEMHPEWEVSAEKVSEARAAVAELIAANRKITAIYGPLSASMRIGSERREAWRELFAALARIGGAS